MRKFYFAGNWKMHKTPNEAREFAVDFAAQMGDCQHKLMIAPSFVAIPALSDALKQTGVLVGAQNCAAEVHGAFTGEVSAPMLASSGTDVVIVGHSERRTLFGEDDKLINTKVLRVLEHGMEVILCVGESLEEREAGKAMTVVLGQIEAGLQGIAAVDMRRITIAYEPVWAIGTGKTATPQDANEVHAGIREKVADMYSRDIAESLCIQYGGSVKPNNVRELMAMEHIDGALVGGASLSVKDFTSIVLFDRD